MSRYQIALCISGVATLLNVIGLVVIFGFGVNSDIIALLMVAGVVLGIISYIFGGLWTAIKMAAGIAKWGLLATAFPFSIFTFILAFFVALLVFVLIPFVPVKRAANEHGF